LSTIRWSGGKGFILFALALLFSLPTDIKSVAKPGETSLGISEQKVERHHLAEPALRQFIEFRKEVIASGKHLAESTAAELALPSGLLSGTPQNSLDPEFADGVSTLEENLFLIDLYAAKYGVQPQILGQIVEAESRHNPEAQGREGERGLGQFLSSTWLGTPQGEKYGWDAAWHPAVNIEAIAWMLSQGRIGEFHAIR